MNIPERTSLQEFELSTEIMSYDQVSGFVNDSISSTNLSDLNGNIDKSKIENFGSYLSSSSRLSDINDNEIANYLTREDLPDVVKLVVSACTYDDAVVSGQKVMIYAGCDDTYPLMYSKNYDAEPVTFKVTTGMEYFIKITNNLPGHFKPSTSHGFATMDKIETLFYQDVQNIRSFEGLQQCLSSFDTIEEAKVLIGKVFDDIWIDKDVQFQEGDAKTQSLEGKTKYTQYSSNRDKDDHPIWYDPLIITDIRSVEDEYGVTHPIAAVLMRVYASKNIIVFDTPNTEVATEDTAIANVFYYGLEKGQTGTAAKNLTILSLNEGDTVPYDDYAKIYKNAYRDEYKFIVGCGHNRYETSAIRQYLNSSAGRGLWWSSTEKYPKHVGQVKPADKDMNYSGYLCGCSADLLNAVKEVKCTTAKNGKSDGTGLYYTYDKFFIPSAVEMFAPGNVNEDGYQVEYWRMMMNDPEASPPLGDSTKINQYRIYYCVNSKTVVAQYSNRWFRSSSTTDPTQVRILDYQGKSTVYSHVWPNKTAYAIPACVIY